MKKTFLSELKGIYEQLEGNKTYIVAALIAIGTFAKLVGWISEEEFQGFLGILGALGLYTLRSAVKKLE